METTTLHEQLKREIVAKRDALLSVRLPSEFLVSVEKAAEAKGMNLSAFVRVLLEFSLRVLAQEREEDLAEIASVGTPAQKASALTNHADCRVPHSQQVHERIATVTEILSQSLDGKSTGALLCDLKKRGIKISRGGLWASLLRCERLAATKENGFVVWRLAKRGNP